VEFRILGPLQVSHENTVLHIQGHRQNVTLALLLLEPDTVVPMERLIDAVWDDEPPSTARTQVQICVSALRRAFAKAGGDPMIDTRSPGYLLRLGAASLDSHDFEARVSAGRRALAAGDAGDAARQMRAALTLWRGNALASIDGTVVQQSVMHLNEQRLAVLSECFDAELNAGQSHELVAELVRLTQEYPLRERFRFQLMMALYRGGRQAEALEVYRATRGTLMDELGIEPSPDLKLLHQAILNGAELPVPGGAVVPTRRIADRGVVAAAGRESPPDAARPAETPVAGPSVPTWPHGTTPAVAVPRLLPGTIPDFTGRSAIVEQIVAASTCAAEERSVGVVPVNVISGRGGAGKTTLAVHAANLLAARFPQGQLFARLRVSGRAVDSADVLERFLRALGAPAPSIPGSLEERAELYRDLLASRRLLVVLDDAVSQQQVMPLLPGGSECAVIITSRRRLTGLPTVTRHEIGAFSQADAVEVLGRVVGVERIGAERDAAEGLCELCGNLPLAIRIVAARLAARPHWSVAALVDRLLDESRRLDELNYGEMGVRASISVTYDSLSSDAGRLLRLLALIEAPSFSSWVGSPLLQVDTLYAEDLLEELTESYLLDTEPNPVGEPVRYRFHDITRPFALERLAQEDSPAERRDALSRLIGALLSLTGEAHRRVYSGDYLLPARIAPRWPLPDGIADRLLADPLAWYEQERLSILAAVRQASAGGLAGHACDLALSTVPLYEARSYFSDWRESHETALKATCLTGDKRGEAAMRYSLGSLYMFEQQDAVAARQFSQAGELFEHLGDRHGVAMVLRNVAVLDRRCGNIEQALARWDEALGTFQVVGDRIAEAHVLYNMAQARIDCGEDGDARGLLERARDICRETGNRRVGAQVRHRLGELDLRGGNLDAACAEYNTTLGLVRESGDRIGECYALLGLASVDLRRGAAPNAVHRLTETLEIARATGERLVETRVLVTLAEAHLRTGDVAEAAALADRAFRNSESMGVALLKAQVLVTQGHVYRALGRQDDADQAWRLARAVTSCMNTRGTTVLAREIDQLLNSTDGAPPRAPAT
jgi:DNA-binding SARP family transcriptional activator/tetratricopeptide (TPR) repeat protein